MKLTATKTTELKEMLAFAFSAAELVEGLAKGIDFGDLAKAVKTARLAFSAFKDAQEALDEYLGLDEESAAEIEAWAIATFNLDNDSVEQAIEMGLKLLIQFRDLVALLVKK